MSSPHGRLETALERILIAKPVLTARQRVAYDLYAGSFSQTNSDARFVLLVMAVESMLEPKQRTEAAQALVEDFIARVKDSGLHPDEIASLSNTATWLKQESISKTGRRLAATLRPRTYAGEDAVTFFTRCYDLRSRLVHGADPRPSRDEVDLRASRLEHFVSHLVSGSLLEDDLGPVN